MLTVLLAASAFAFAGVYLSTLVVPAVLCAVLLIAYRPWPERSVTRRWSTEWWLALAVVLMLLQLVPLPASIIDAVSPHARDAWRRLALGTRGALPVSLDVRAGLWALLVAACAFAAYLAALRIFARGGVRAVTRGVAAIGLTLSAIALAQEASGHGLMYWRWQPLDEGAHPFGPFVNRNHFGTWVVLAAPLVFGYILAHAAAHHHPGSSTSRHHVSWRARLRTRADARTIWLIASTVMMLAALGVSLSRSSMFGFAVAGLLGLWLRPASRRFAGRGAERWIAAALVIAAAAVLVRIDAVTLSTRLAAAPVSAASRLVIWRDTVPVVRDFWLTGTGAGTYETVMLVYQRSTREVRFNQAHNHYLQLAAEGGLLLGIPLLMGLRAWLRDARARIAADTSGMYFVRAGAACGLAGVAAQSLWETGLTTPANAILAAVLAAIVVHEPVRADRAGDA